ncbi:MULTISPECIES: carbonic anhydrase [unclassified Oleiphilus]|uniref:carbonic anhydrase n=2 Tax=Oleiphilus TaxID=141450 RepID=UPI0012E7F6C0|nr:MULTISPECIES: carbonic anhydrase [unclassified Oleiphilus]
MSKIVSGILKFKKDVHSKKKELFEKLSQGQAPEALFITCSDSRIDPNLLVQTEPGELFIIRNAGNIVPPHSSQTGGVTASIEYAVAALQVKHIVICGHSCCGAMQGVMNPQAVSELPHVSQWLSFSNAALQVVKEKYPNDSDQEQLNHLIEQNVLLQTQHLVTHPQVAAKLATGKITLHAWYYDIGSGDVRAYDESLAKFVSVEEKYKDLAKAMIVEQDQCGSNHDC